MDSKSGNTLPAITLKLLEAVVDLSTGILMLFLLGPLFYGVSIAFREGSPSEELLVMVFPNFWRLFTGLSLATMTPWLIIAVSFVLGIISRAVFTIYNIFPIKWLERKVIAWASFQLLMRWHGLLGNWTLEKITAELVQKTPFQHVGDRAFTEFRANLEDPEGTIKRLKPLWDHEVFLYFRSQHFYGMFLSFLLVYMIYGIGIIALTGLHFPEFGIWLGILLLLFILVVLLLQEVIIHGVAFAEINDLAREQSSSPAER